MTKIFYSLCAAVLVLASAVSADPRLIMVEQDGCYYCRVWDEEIAHIYPKTAEGQYAPLLRADIYEGPPEGVTYARRVNFTPTFVLVEDGRELARIEGYPGEDFFWGLLTQLLEQNTDFKTTGLNGSSG